VWVLAVFLLEAGSQSSIQLDGDEVFGACGQLAGERAAAGSDLDYDAITDVAEGSDDAFDGSGVGEKILPEWGLLRLWRASLHL
jgi:hypothetical protein